MFAASSVSARFSSFKQHAGWRQADRGGCCCGGLFWEVFFPPYRRMIKAAQHNAEKHNVKKALQGPFDTLTHAQQCRQNNTRVVYSLVTHFINHSRTHLQHQLCYILLTLSWKWIYYYDDLFSADKLCDFVSQIAEKIKCMLLFYLFFLLYMKEYSNNITWESLSFTHEGLFTGCMKLSLKTENSLIASSLIPGLTYYKKEEACS